MEPNHRQMLLERNYRHEDEILELLAQLGADELERDLELQALVLGMCLCHEESSVRKEAKKVAKKLGPPNLEAALSAKSRRNYTGEKAQEAISEDLAELGEIDQKLAAEFASVLATKLNGRTERKPRSAAAAYYYAHASDEEIRAGLARQAGPDGLELRLQGTAPQRIVEMLWEVAAENAASVVEIEYVTDGNGLPELVPTLPRLSSLSIESATVETFPETLFQQPALAALQLRCPNASSLPNSIGDASALTSLFLRDMSRLKHLDGNVGRLSNLFRLKIWDSGLVELPGELGQCESLADIAVGDCAQLKRVGAGLAESTSVRTLSIWGVQEVEIPPEVLDIPSLAPEYREELTLLAAPADSYSSVYGHLEMFVEAFRDRPEVLAALSDRDADSDPPAAAAELLLAASRCYFDEEHGRSSNRFYADQIDEYAPEPLRAANERIRDIPFVDSSTSDDTLAELFAALDGIEDFDAGRFETFVHAMIAEG